MTSYETVQYDVEGAVATVTLNRPDAMNAFNAGLRADLPAALNRAGNDTDIRVVIITGAGRAFNPGADLKEGIPSSVEQMLNTEYRQTFDAIFNMPKPVIAAVNGFAAGIGLSLAVAADLTIMTEESFLLSPFSTISLVPDGGANWLLVQHLGYKRAFQLAVEAERIPAQRALELGLTNRVVPADELMTNAREWAESLAKRAPLSIWATKKAMRLATHASYDEVFRMEASLQGQCVNSEDAQEGVDAFFEKRSPEFKGR